MNVKEEREKLVGELQDTMQQLLTSEQPEERMMGRLMATGLFEKIEEYTEAEVDRARGNGFRNGDYVVCMLKLIVPSLLWVLLKMPPETRSKGIEMMTDDLKRFLEKTVEEAVEAGFGPDETGGNVIAVESLEEAMQIIEDLIEARAKDDEGKLN